jgi:hypothetical protein
MEFWRAVSLPETPPQSHKLEARDARSIPIARLGRSDSGRSLPQLVPQVELW